MHLIVKVIDIIDPMVEIDEDFKKGITHDEFERLMREDNLKMHLIKDRDLW